MTSLPEPRLISAAKARRFMLGHLGLRRFDRRSPKTASRALLQKLRCIQLDPLDAIGSNADLVAMARIDKQKRGDIYKHLLPGIAFEHFAKERCLLPAEAFPYYREHALEAPWWRLSERLKRVPEKLIRAVRDELAEAAPASGRQLEPRGRVKAIDWSGWKGTSRATTMALEVLWTRCEAVVYDRQPAGKRYSLPEQSLGDWAEAPTETSLGRWGLLERVQSAGLLTLATGPQWGLLEPFRRSTLPAELVKEGSLEHVQVKGSRRTYLAPAGFLDRRFSSDDGQMRILAPLDPLIWDRKLVHHIFDFEYIWEVYKPKKKRRWGWYVCPLLHQGQLVGRFEGVMKGNTLKVLGLWKEEGQNFDENAFDAALSRHQQACR